MHITQQNLILSLMEVIVKYEVGKYIICYLFVINKKLELELKQFLNK